MLVSDQILATKLLAPRTGFRLIDRTRLIQRFAGYEERKLTLLTAPAGYGKSVLLSQFVGQLDSPFVWYHLDNFDNDLAVFIQYLIAGTARHLDGFGSTVLDQIGKGDDLAGRVRLLVTALVNELSLRLDDKNLLLVFDDYHVIEESLIHSFVGDLLENLPRQIHLVIAGRSVPPLPLARLKVADMVIEFGLDELKFNRAEIGEFLATEHEQPVKENVVSSIESETQGWPAALRLAGSSLVGSTNQEINGLNRKPGIARRKEIYDYLASEVLHSLPDTLERFVTDTSVLDVLTPSICDMLLDRTDAVSILETLELKNLFIVALDGDETAYRYHHLFRDFLQNRLGGRKNELLRKAGECYLQAGSTNLSVEYYLRAGDFQNAVAVLEKAGGDTLRRGRGKTLNRWLSALPEQAWSDRPHIQLLQGALAIMHGKIGRAETMIDRAAEAFERSGDREGLIQSLLHKARILRSRGDYDSCLKLLENILPELVHRPIAEWYDVCLEQSFALTLQGKLDAAIGLLNGSLQAAERDGESIIAALLAEKLGELYYFKGEYSRAVEVHQRAVEMAPDPERTAYSIRDNIAIIYRDWGDLDSALEYARKSVETKELLGLVEALPYAYHQMAIILADMGQIEAAEEHFRRAIGLARDTGGEAFFLTLSTALYGRLLGVLGRFAEARELVDEAVEKAKNQSEFIYGICLEVAAPIYEQTGSPDQAVRMLHQALEILERIGAKFSLCIACGALARISFNIEDLSEARKFAARCLELAAAESYLQMFLTYREMLLPVVRMGIEEGFQPEFIAEIVKRYGSTAEEMLVASAGHADPRVRRRAVQLITLISGKTAVGTVRALLEDPDEGVRDCALAALQQLEQPKQAPAPKREQSGQAVNLQPVADQREVLLNVFCFGPFRAAAGDRELTWRTTKARDLLAFLVHNHARPVDREKILEGIWPETDPEQSSALFHTNLYQLRKTVKTAFGEHNIVTKHSGSRYRLNNELVFCDTIQFTQLVKQAEGKNSDAARAALESAVSLYQGEYLEGLDYEWVVAERERLSQLYLSALEHLAGLCLESEEYSRAASFLRAILRVNPLLEEAHSRLMTVYARMGDRMAVMQQYETLTQVLEEELGVGPGLVTRELYYKLCSEES